jgi:hypothetical protein
MPKQPAHTYDHEMYDSEQEKIEDSRYTPTMIEQGVMSTSYILRKIRNTNLGIKVEGWYHDWINTLTIGAGLIGMQTDRWLLTPYE